VAIQAPIVALPLVPIAAVAIVVVAIVATVASGAVLIKPTGEHHLQLHLLKIQAMVRARHQTGKMDLLLLLLVDLRILRVRLAQLELLSMHGKMVCCPINCTLTQDTGS
jgi:hypothetical protein